MKIFRWQGLILAAVLTSAGCRSIPPQPAATPKNPASVSTNATLDGKWHSIQISPSPKLPEIRIWQKFNPVWWFENSDDPVPPAWYLPGDKNRNTKWLFRNPFHNFNFYVIGIADKKFMRSGRYPEKISNPNGGWDFAISRREIIFLPFISYQRGRFEFYLGWRTQGNFGVKFNISVSNENQKPQPSAAPP